MVQGVVQCYSDPNVFRYLPDVLDIDKQLYCLRITSSINLAMSVYLPCSCISVVKAYV